MTDSIVEATMWLILTVCSPHQLNSCEEYIINWTHEPADCLALAQQYTAAISSDTLLSVSCALNDSSADYPVVYTPIPAGYEWRLVRTPQ